MISAGATELVAAVEETTGYKVVLDNVEGIGEDARTVSARPESPVHRIEVNKERLRYGDYIVALQCAILLRTWADVSRIPVFTLVSEKGLHFVNWTASGRAFAKIPPDRAQKATESNSPGSRLGRPEHRPSRQGFIR